MELFGLIKKVPFSHILFIANEIWLHIFPHLAATFSDIRPTDIKDQPAPPGLQYLILIVMKETLI